MSEILKHIPAADVFHIGERAIFEGASARVTACYGFGNEFDYQIEFTSRSGPSDRRDVIHTDLRRPHSPC